MNGLENTVTSLSLQNSLLPQNLLGYDCFLHSNLSGPNT